MIDLKAIIASYPECIKIRSQFASLLHDFYPLDKRSVNIILAIYDSGIAARISGLKSIDSTQVNVFLKLLEDEFGFQERYAIEGIKAWATAYEISGSESISTAQMPDMKISAVQKTDFFSKAGEIVTGRRADYELEFTEGGVIIAKYMGSPDEEDIIVPNIISGRRVIGIGEGAYRGLGMRTVKISDGIKYIRDAAFAECKKLVKVTLPETLKRLGSVRTSKSKPLPEKSPLGVFQLCSALQIIELPGQLTYLGRFTFRDCSSLRSISLPDNIAEIRSNTFYRCKALETIVLPKRLTAIGAHSFTGCEKLADIGSFPPHLREIGFMAFCDCHNLKAVVFPSSLRKIGAYAFSRCTSLTEAVMNKGLQEIGERAFHDCTSLTCALLPETITNIEASSNDTDIFVVSDKSGGYTKNDKLTIYCYSDSYGLKYAWKFGYPVQNALKYKK